MKFKLIFMIFGVANFLFAYDGDMDIYHEFKEDLSLVNDSYLLSLNMAIENTNDETLNRWFDLRAQGGAKTWKQLEFNVPDLKYLTLTEIPYGFKLKGSHGAYKVDAEVKVLTRDSDIFYDVKFLKATNAPGKEIMGEVFRNDRVIYFDEDSPCSKKAVTCINEYAKGTLGTP